MQCLAVVALLAGLIMLLKWLGAPVRRLPGEKKVPTRNPEEEVPPPALMS